MPLHLHVAGIAGLGDAGFRQDGFRRLGTVCAVAVRAGDTSGLVDAAPPEHPLDILGMARSHTLGILHLDRFGAFPEGDDRLDGFTGRVHVQAAGAVTRLTILSFLGCPRVLRKDLTHHRAVKWVIRDFVAFEARVGPRILGVGRGTCPLGLWRIGFCGGGGLSVETFGSGER